MARRKTGILFMQSITSFGSESMIHSLIAGNLDREKFDVHVACNPGDLGMPSEAFAAFRALPAVHFRATNFGPNVDGRSKADVAKQLPRVVPSMIDLTRLARYVKLNQIDIIHCTEKRRDAFYGVLIARMTGTKSIVHLHLKYADWMSSMTRWAIQHADGVIGVSPFVADSARANGVSSDRLYYVLNSIVADRWNFRLDGSAVREEYGIAPNVPIIASISRLFHWKGQDKLIRALATIADRVPEYKLLIVGTDDLHASGSRGSYTAELRALTAELQLENRVIFTGWRTDIERVLAACDVFALPSFEEPCAVAFLEAMAMQRPVVALANGGTPCLVEHGRAGLLSEPEDIHQLGENLLTLLTNPALRREMGEYGRKRVEDYFTPRRLAAEVEEVYRRVLGRD
jgi:glycosyltransferase involved in cell wall biosynthesis